MILTINIIDTTNRFNKKVMGCCNIEYDCPNIFDDEIRNNYEKIIPKAAENLRKECTSFTIPEVLSKATEIIKEKFNEFIVIEVNWDRDKINNKNCLNWNLSKNK